MIELALSNDASVSPAVADGIRRLLNGEEVCGAQMSGPLLMTMTDAAKHLGVGRVTFWRLVKKRVFEPVEISDRVFRYRKADLEAFVAAKAEYLPVSRESTNQS